jgi:hypothetical protein
VSLSLRLHVWGVLPVTLALGSVGIPAVGSAATVARPGAQTAVREYGGTIVFSAFDQAESRWYLSVRRAGAKRARRLGVASSEAPFDADIGTDSGGRPQLIYQRCALAPPTGTALVGARVGCDLFVYSLARTTGERAVRNANDATHNDVHGTIWRGRIAWTRQYGSGKAANPVVYTKTLTAPRSQPSRRLPGVPARVRGNVEPIVSPTTDRNVQALELWGNNLAVIVNYTCAQCSGFGHSEVRLDKVAEGTSGRVASLVSGLSGQGLVGLSFFDGRLAWYRGCGDCLMSYVGPWRYRLSTRSYGRGTPGPMSPSGFADTGTHLYETVGCAPPPPQSLPQDNANCRIDKITPPTFAVAPAPIPSY